MRQRLYIIAAVLALVLAFQAVSLGARILGDRLWPSAFAQSPAIQSVDIKRGVLKYTWADGPDGPATELRIKCGPNAGQYTFTRIVPVTASGEVSLAELLPKHGLYYCAIAGATKYGEGPLSSDYPFDAGGVPSGKGTLSIGLK
jgi:hypothetical protein